MAVTLELIAAPGQTLTADIYPRGSDTAAESDIALTERTNCKGVYRGTVTATLTGWHRVEAKDGVGDVMALTDANFDGSDPVYTKDDVYVSQAIDATVDLGSLEDTINEILDRIREQVPEGPVLNIPAAPGKTVAWGYTFDKTGDIEVGVAVRLWLDGGSGHGMYEKDRQTAVSNSEGVVFFEIPRNASLRFVVQRECGPVVRFSGVDSETLELPMVIG